MRLGLAHRPQIRAGTENEKEKGGPTDGRFPIAEVEFVLYE